MTEYRWLLPSVLLGGADEGQPVRRSMRDWIVDTLLFLAACGIALLSLSDIEDDPPALVLTELVVGALACGAVWLRRRWPVMLPVVLAMLSTGLVMVGGPQVVALFSVAVHRPFKVAGPVVLLSTVTLFPYVALRPDPELGYWPSVVVGIAFSGMLLAWGMVVRARRQVVWSLRAQAEVAAEEARRLERERIAREMHDVLAHRISILSLHAGALEFHPDAPPEQIAKAAGAIRSSAHEALQDLRQVIGVLRHTPDDPTPERPQPTLADLPALVEESRQAGMDVTLDLQQPEPPEAVGRNAYRIVQEALTNARKHAPGAPVTVSVAGEPVQGTCVTVRNLRAVPAGRARRASAIPGTGTGLIGLAERVDLAGGRLEHGADSNGDFVLRAWLPWP